MNTENNAVDNITTCYIFTQRQSKRDRELERERHNHHHQYQQYLL